MSVDGRTYRVCIRENARERMGKVTPRRDEDTARWRRKTRVADDLK